MDAGEGLETPDAGFGDGEPLLERALAVGGVGVRHATGTPWPAGRYRAAIARS